MRGHQAPWNRGTVALPWGFGEPVEARQPLDMREVVAKVWKSVALRGRVTALCESCVLRIDAVALGCTSYRFGCAFEVELQCKCTEHTRYVMLLIIPHLPVSCRVHSSTPLYPSMVT